MDALSALRHRVTIQDPRTHLVDVTLHLPAAGADGEHRITMPAWTPGSYLIREFARQVEGLRAEGEGGHELPVSKIAKGTWAVRAGAGRAATVRYRVYAHELTVRTSCITADFALLNGGGVFFQLEGAAGAPQEVEVVAPPGWKVHCALPRAPGGALRARDFEELVDSPIECGPFDAEPLELPGAGAVQAEVVWVGWEWCDAPPPRAEVRADLARLFAPTAAVFGQGYPFQRYLFIVHLVEGYGGLEHRASSVLLYSRSGLRPKDKYEKFMALASHELFHAWNGKRLRPRVLGPFDYEREAYTRALWLVEGVTSYYDELLLRRAGLIGVESYLKYLAGQVRKLDETPGRAMQSLEEASFDAWVKLYRPDEHTPNSTVSYYLKGEIVGLLLDLEIRARSGGARSLDDVMRRLWVQYGREGARGYEDDAPFATIAEVAGREVLELAERWIRGRDDLDYGVTLGRAGLALERTSEDGLAAGPGVTGGGGGGGEGGAEGRRGWLGVVTAAEAGRRAVVRNVMRGSPAERGGLEPGDEIVALDGVKVDEGSLAERCRARSAGATIRLTVFRLDVLREVTLTLGEAPPDTYRIVKRRDASAAERAVYESWMGAGWDEPPPPAAGSPVPTAAPAAPLSPARS